MKEISKAGLDNKCLQYKEGQVWSGDFKTIGGRNRARQGKTRVKGTNGAKEEGQHKRGNGVGNT